MTKDEFTQKALDSEQMLYRISMSMLKNNADCEDAVQQTILTAYKRLNSLKHEEFFRTWILSSPPYKLTSVDLPFFIHR